MDVQTVEHRDVQSYLSAHSPDLLTLSRFVQNEVQLTCIHQQQTERGGQEEIQRGLRTFEGLQRGEEAGSGVSR